ncbi:H-NS histone family protein [Lentibacter algarum]|uniref:H-NS histone family protein n=1 Tax=Lentibacter algarum TaxID=576131 RepID=UPI00339D8BB2
MDLNTLSLKELKDLQDKVAIAIFDFERRKKAETLVELKALAQSKGFSLEELLDNGKANKKKTPVAAKYADPANPDNTWSGRGRKPKWLAAALENGASIENFAL